MLEKIKLIHTYFDRKDVFTVFLIILVSLVSFILGKLSVLEQKHVPVTVEMVPVEQSALNTASVVTAGDLGQKKLSQTLDQTVKKTVSVDPMVPALKKYVASKTGTKYHLPSCSGAKRISEKNKIWFATKEEAEQAGFSPASNCKGI